MICKTCFHLVLNIVAELVVNF